MTQKEIDALSPSEKALLIPCKEPKELYLRVYPSGKKVFQLREQKQGFYITLGECRKGIFNLTNARAKALNILSQIANGEFVGKNAKSLSLESANEQYLQSLIKRLSPATIKKEQGTFKKYLLATLGNKDINALCKADFLPVFELMARKGINETFSRLSAYLLRMLDFYRLKGQLRTNIINDIKDLQSYFKKTCEPKPVQHFKAITDEAGLKKLLECLKLERFNPRTNINALNAVYFALYTAQRSKNIRLAKWSQIDFENKIWRVNAEEMKVKSNGEQLVSLNEGALRVLQEQSILNADKEYIFFNYQKPLSINFWRKMFLKYDLPATLHGFRASFKSACVDKSDELLALGIGESISEMVLHHSVGDNIAKAYNRAKATHLKARLMQWWCEYLAKLEA